MRYYHIIDGGTDTPLLALLCLPMAALPYTLVEATLPSVTGHHAPIWACLIGTVTILLAAVACVATLRKAIPSLPVRTMAGAYGAAVYAMMVHRLTPTTTWTVVAAFFGAVIAYAFADRIVEGN